MKVVSLSLLLATATQTTTGELVAKRGRLQRALVAVNEDSYMPMSSSTDLVAEEIVSNTNKPGKSGKSGTKKPLECGTFPAVFASTFATPITLSSSSTDGNGLVTTLESDLDIGTVVGPSVLQASIKTRIVLLLSDFDDDDAVAGLGKVSLEILAFKGCTSTATCSSVLPISLTPGLVSIIGMSKEIQIGDNDDSLLTTGVVSTDMAMFVLMDSGPHFLQAHFVLKTEAETSDADIDAGDLVNPPTRRLQESDVQVSVDNYIIMATRTA